LSVLQYASPPEGIRATARHILVKTPNDAQVALKKLEAGALFSTLASEMSTCPSGRQGGSLGSFTPGTMVREFDDVIFSPVTQIGQIVGPIQTQVRPTLYSKRNPE
jgi:peptidyl-prolyl cis-trans isomerase C